MTRGLRLALSHTVGWIADRRIPGPLRETVYKGYARFTGADLDEVRLPLKTFPSLGAFFVRELKPGARTFPTAPEVIGSPVDGTVQSLCRIERGTVLQAKGRSYTVSDMLGHTGRDADLEGGFAWTIYLSPRDYHRIHAPEKCRLTELEWMPGDRFSVAPKVLAQRRVLDVNERCVLRLECERAPLYLVLVGALNVGRMRVVGVEPTHSGPLARPRAFERGAELARFEMGSTIVLFAPPGTTACESALREGASVRMGSAIGRWIA
ncbi:MAG: phosphatidylserine decarboxylase [Planctomycetes bacterium]|nr:phosphatidylserine decarboxylase [Planctomycetota bacterium]